MKYRFAVQSIYAEGDGIVSRHRHLATAEKICRRKNRQFGRRYNGRRGFSVVWWDFYNLRWNPYLDFESYDEERRRLYFASKNRELAT